LEYVRSALIDYTKFLRDNFAKEKAIIQRLGLAAKPA